MAVKRGGGQRAEEWETASLFQWKRGPVETGH